jgi:hypothetical protein
MAIYVRPFMDMEIQIFRAKYEHVQLCMYEYTKSRPNAAKRSK